jgi:hypothetical protein
LRYLSGIASAYILPFTGGLDGFTDGFLFFLSTNRTVQVKRLIYQCVVRFG